MDQELQRQLHHFAKQVRQHDEINDVLDHWDRKCNRVGQSKLDPVREQELQPDFQLD